MENIMDEINENPVLTINYDVKNEEEGQAFLFFQKKYVYKKNWIKTIAFAIVALVFLWSVYKTPDQPLNYMFVAICVAAIFVIWHNTRKIRTSLMDALKILEGDKYLFSLYEDKFTIETVEAETVDENGEPLPPIQPRVVTFADTTLNVFEAEDKFIIVLKKDTIYVLPKRCMNEEQIAVLRNTLSEKLKEDFEKLI